MRYFQSFKSISLIAAAALSLWISPAEAQSRNVMLNECSNVAQTYFRDFTAGTEMKYNGQRTDGTHAINGRIFLETRFEDFACSFARNGRRMVDFFAEGRSQNAYLPQGGNGGGNQQQGNVVQVTGVSAGDTLNVRSGPGTGNRIVGALSNGTSVRNLGCQMQGNSRWCQIEMMTDMRERGWVNARYLSGQGGGQATQLPSASRMQRVTFSSGSTGTEFTDRLSRGTSVTYLLGARNGQDLYFRLAANSPGLSYKIFNPDGSLLLGETNAAQEYRGQLWQSGDHKIEVRNLSNRQQSFNVIFGVR